MQACPLGSLPAGINSGQTRAGSERIHRCPYLSAVFMFYPLNFLQALRLSGACRLQKHIFRHTLLFLPKASRIFFHQLPRDHDLVSAADALQPEVRAHAKNFPLTAAARMRLFQFHNISNFVIHNYLTFIRAITCPIGSSISRSALSSTGVALRFSTISASP